MFLSFTQRTGHTLVSVVWNGSPKRRALAPESVMVFVVTNSSPKGYPKGRPKDFPRAVRKTVREPSKIPVQNPEGGLTNSGMSGISGMIHLASQYGRPYQTYQRYQSAGGILLPHPSLGGRKAKTRDMQQVSGCRLGGRLRNTTRR